uniref:Uncharacterized protein n=1 Tax=Arundo donax TaxID=35708 RepID=A0A0A8Y9B9_ARUDO
MHPTKELQNKMIINHHHIDSWITKNKNC